MIMLKPMARQRSMMIRSAVKYPGVRRQVTPSPIPISARSTATSPVSALISHSQTPVARENGATYGIKNAPRRKLCMRPRN